MRVCLSISIGNERERGREEKRKKIYIYIYNFKWIHLEFLGNLNERMGAIWNCVQRMGILVRYLLGCDYTSRYLYFKSVHTIACLQHKYETRKMSEDYGPIRCACLFVHLAR